MGTDWSQLGIGVTLQILVPKVKGSKDLLDSNGFPKKGLSIKKHFD